jgi:hypothetical protein
MGRCPPPDLPSLKDPEWLSRMKAAFPNQPDLHRKFAAQRAAQIEMERQVWLARMGQATAPIRAKIASEAFNHRHSEKWRKFGRSFYQGPFGEEEYGIGSNKCNLFVYDMLTAAGAPVQLQARFNGFGGRLPAVRRRCGRQRQAHAETDASKGLARLDEALSQGCTIRHVSLDTYVRNHLCTPLRDHYHRR